MAAYAASGRWQEGKQGRGPENKDGFSFPASLRDGPAASRGLPDGGQGSITLCFRGRTRGWRGDGTGSRRHSGPGPQLGLDPGSQHTGKSGRLGKPLEPSVMATGPRRGPGQSCLCTWASLLGRSPGSVRMRGSSEVCGWLAPGYQALLGEVQHPGLWPRTRPPQSGRGKRPGLSPASSPTGSLAQR